MAIEADSLDASLIDWLNELIFRSETGQRLYGRFEIVVDVAAPDRPRLSGTIRGEPIDPDRHVLDHEVKAVTRHGLRLTVPRGAWLAEVILDI